MSQVAKALSIVPTGERFLSRGFSPLFKDVLDEGGTGLKYSAPSLSDYVVCHRYKLQLRLNSDFVLTEDEVTYAKHDLVPECMSRAKRHMVEAIFGEFRPQLIRIRMAINNYDMVEATKLLTELEQQMFSIDGEDLRERVK